MPVRGAVVCRGDGVGFFGVADSEDAFWEWGRGGGEVACVRCGGGRRGVVLAILVKRNELLEGGLFFLLEGAARVASGEGHGVAAVRGGGGGV